MILSGDHVYRMDYGALLAKHVETGADMTVCCIEVPCEEAANTFGVMTVDDNKRVRRFDEKPAEPSSIPGKEGTCLASMGNYVFNTEFLSNFSLVISTGKVVIVLDKISLLLFGKRIFL